MLFIGLPQPRSWEAKTQSCQTDCTTNRGQNVDAFVVCFLYNVSKFYNLTLGVGDF